MREILRILEKATSELIWGGKERKRREDKRREEGKERREKEEERSDEGKEKSMGRVVSCVRRGAK